MIGNASTIPGCGSTTGYRHGCRCENCRAEVTAASQQRRRARAQIGPLTTDAAPIRARVELLRDSGLTYGQIARATNLHRSTIVTIAGAEGRTATRRVSTETARRIMGARPRTSTLRPNDTIDATGTRRRLQALAVLGWHTTLLAPRIGVHTKTIAAIRRGVTPTVLRRVADSVSAVFEQLWCTPAPDSPRVAQVRTQAAREGWLSGGAWGDGIDDPAASPVVCEPDVGAVDVVAVARALAGGPVALTRAEQVRVAQVLHAERGVSLAETASQVGVTDRTVLRWKQSSWRTQATADREPLAA